MRRPLPERRAEKARKAARRQKAKQLTLSLNEALYQGERYEYAVLVTSLKDEVLSNAQHYRDRADSENNFDELKNQWGRVHDTGSETMPAHGAFYGADLQLVDNLHAAGNPGQACRGRHFATTGPARNRANDQARQPDNGRSDQHPFQGRIDHQSPGKSQWITPSNKNEGRCGAVDVDCQVEPHPKRCIPVFPPRNHTEQRCPAHPNYRLTAVFRMNWVERQSRRHESLLWIPSRSTSLTYRPSCRQWAALCQRSSPSASRR